MATLSNMATALENGENLGGYCWRTVMAHKQYLSMGSHETIHDAMAYYYVMQYLSELTSRQQAKMLNRISESSRKNGWEGFRRYRRRRRLPLYRGGPPGQITWVSVNPKLKGEHFRRETNKTWCRLDILEDEMHISQMTNKERREAGWLNKTQTQELDQKRPERVRIK